MAITLITGVPGMGKSAQVVTMLLENDLKREKARPVFVMGIPNLLIDHAPCPPVADWTEQRPDPDDPSLMLDYFTFPPDSIIVIDEAQKVYRNRSAVSKVPPIVASFETHRHLGIDFILLTQKPKQIDSAVRDLVGRHIHIRNTMFFGRRLYEWPEYRPVDVEANFKDAAIRKFSPPKQSFKYYKSAEVHTKQERRIHNVFFFLPVAIAFTVYNGWGIFSKIFSKGAAEVDPITKMQEVQQAQNHPAQSPADNIQNVNATTEPKAPPVIPHPYMGFDFVIKAVIHSARFNETYFELYNDNKKILINSTNLKKLGYEIMQNDDCSAFLYFQGAQIVATCSAQPAEALGARQRTLEPEAGQPMI